MNINDLVNSWESLEPNLLEIPLNTQFTNHIWNYLGMQSKTHPHLGSGLQPDFMVYNQRGKPFLLVETKKRTPHLAKLDDNNFVDACQNNPSYKDAITQIEKYLSVKDHHCKYGLIFNGDFYQLFKRLDGLIFPLTEVTKVTKETLPTLIKQIEYCENDPHKAFIISMWNRKGGVAKTTNTFNIAGVLAALKKRVLVIDFDPQNDLTESFGLNPDDYEDKLIHCLDKIQLGEKQAAKNLLNKWRQVKTFNLENKDYDISILPGHRKTLEIFGGKTSEDESQYDDSYEMLNKQTGLKRLLSLLSLEYDYILIDTSPQTDLLTLSSLFAADGILIPSDFNPHTLRHVKEISQDYIPNTIRQQRIKDSRKSHSLFDDINPRVLGVIFSNCPSIGVTMEREIAANIADLPIKFYENRLPKYDRIPLALFNQTPVLFDTPSSQATKKYLKLTREIFIEPNFIGY